MRIRGLLGRTLPKDEVDGRIDASSDQVQIYVVLARIQSHLTEEY